MNWGLKKYEFAGGWMKKNSWKTWQEKKLSLLGIAFCGFEALVFP